MQVLADRLDQPTASTLPIKVFDFFSGCGGSSEGFRQAGMDIVLALDINADAERTFQANFPEATFLRKDIRSVTVEELEPYHRLCAGNPVLFCGCAPCQPFSQQNTQLPEHDDRLLLLDEFARFVGHYHPEFVFVENVPGMQRVSKGGVFERFIGSLEASGYWTMAKRVYAQEYGVPQKRRRLVLLASRLGPIGFPVPTHGPPTTRPKYATVGEWMKDLPSLEAGEAHPDDHAHQAAKLSEMNLTRLKALKEGQDRRAWPPELVLNCHKGEYKGHTDVYGRMSWESLSNCLTTRCHSLSNGRFGHPEQHRAISAREAACLQTFPRTFTFHGPLASMARQIGNAVPVLLAERFGKNFIEHLETYRKAVSP